MAAMIWIWCVHLFFIIHECFSNRTLVATVRSVFFFWVSWTKSSLNQRGNGGLTHEESKSHFTAWALMKSPLLVRCLSCHYPSGDPYPFIRLERMWGFLLQQQIRRDIDILNSFQPLPQILLKSWPIKRFWRLTRIQWWVKVSRLSDGVKMWVCESVLLTEWLIQFTQITFWVARLDEQQLFPSSILEWSYSKRHSVHASMFPFYSLRCYFGVLKLR